MTGASAGTRGDKVAHYPTTETSCTPVIRGFLGLTSSKERISTLPCNLQSRNIVFSDDTFTSPTARNLSFREYCSRRSNPARVSVPIFGGNLKVRVFELHCRLCRLALVTISRPALMLVNMPAYRYISRHSAEAGWQVGTLVTFHMSAWHNVRRIPPWLKLIETRVPIRVALASYVKSQQLRPAHRLKLNRSH